MLSSTKSHRQATEKDDTMHLEVIIFLSESVFLQTFHM